MAESKKNIWLVPGIVAGLVLTGALTGCGADTAAARPAKTPQPEDPASKVEDKVPDGPSRVAPGSQLPGGHVRVHGIVFALEDHPIALMQRPFAGGTVVAIPSERFRRYQTESRGPFRAMILQGRRFPLRADLINETDVHVGKLATDGTYTLNAVPGDYTFCIGNLETTTVEAAPIGSLWIDTSFDVRVTSDEFQTVVAIFNRITGEVTIHH